MGFDSFSDQNATQKQPYNFTMLDIWTQKHETFAKLIRMNREIVALEGIGVR